MTCAELFIKERHHELLNLCRAKVENGDDLFQDICLWALENKKAKELCERDELLFYILRMIGISSFSKNSPYYYKYKKHNENTQQFQSYHQRAEVETVPLYEKEMEWIMDKLKNLHWFDAKLFEIYYWHNHSLNTLSNETGISRSTINKSICKTKAYLKKEAQRIRGRSGIGSRSDRSCDGGKENTGG